MALTNMKMSADEVKAYTGPSAADVPQYPWGLCLELNDEAMKKLGLSSLPPVGSEMMLTARVVVTRCSSYETQDQDKEMSMGLQITDMDLGAPAMSKDDMAAKLYPGMK